MGHVVLLAGGMMIGMVATKKGYKYRWYAVFVFIVVFCGVVVWETKYVNAQIKALQFPAIQVRLMR
jgi:hypothetical protein